MLNEYLKHVEERNAQGLPPKALEKSQVEALISLVIAPPAGQENLIKDLVVNRIPPGVDPAAEVKAGMLESIALGTLKTPLFTAEEAVMLLGTMLGGYNVKPLTALLEHPTLAPAAVKALSGTLLVFDSLKDILTLAKTNANAKQVVDNWATATWFTEKDALPETLTLTVFKVDGEINTDDLSPAAEAWSRPDIPLHALSMLKKRMENPLETIVELKKKGHPIVFVGDVVGTGSSR